MKRLSASLLVILLGAGAAGAIALTGGLPGRSDRAGPDEIVLDEMRFVPNRLDTRVAKRSSCG